MRVTIEEVAAEQEEELILRCHELSGKMLEIIRQLKAEVPELLGYRDKEIHRLSPQDIYYFEVVDNKSFFYCADSVFESQLKLYEFARITEGTDFFRASKSMVLNASKIDFITPSFSGRFEVMLLNKEKVVVSRQYVAALKKKMGL